MSTRTHYEVLNVTRGAETQTIREAYLSLARQYHPDVNPSSTEKFQEIAESWSVLKDEALRAQYDAKLQIATKECLRCQGTGEVKETIGFTKRYIMRCAVCNGIGRVEKENNN